MSVQIIFSFITVSAFLYWVYCCLFLGKNVLLLFTFIFSGPGVLLFKDNLKYLNDILKRWNNISVFLLDIPVDFW